MEMNISANCKFSDGWLRNFKRRHGIRQLSIVGERKSADTQSAENFRTLFGAIVCDHRFTADEIHNADETGIYWKSLLEY